MLQQLALDLAHNDGEVGPAETEHADIRSGPDSGCAGLVPEQRQLPKVHGGPQLQHLLQPQSTAVIGVGKLQRWTVGGHHAGRGCQQGGSSSGSACPCTPAGSQFAGWQSTADMERLSHWLGVGFATGLPLKNLGKAVGRPHLVSLIDHCALPRLNHIEGIPLVAPLHDGAASCVGLGDKGLAQLGALGSAQRSQQGDLQPTAGPVHLLGKGCLQRCRWTRQSGGKKPAVPPSLSRTSSRQPT